MLPTRNAFLLLRIIDTSARW